MDENFKKFKKRVWFDVLIKCLCYGLGSGLVAVNAVLLPLRLCGIDISWFYFVLIGLGGFLLGGAIAFIILRTDDGKISKLLDSELKLEERVQTSYAFSGQGSAMLDLQRADAAVQLAKSPLKALRFTNLAATVLAGVISVAGVAGIILITNLVQPAYADNNPEGVYEEPPREVSDWEWAALDDLIDYVKNSKKADTYVKTGVVAELSGLKEVLLDGVSESSLSMFVQNTVSNVNNVVMDANSRDISDEQKALNSEEGAYVANRLYEIFNLKNGYVEDTDDDDTEREEPEAPPVSDEEIGGILKGNDIPFFHPDKGQITVGEAREEYLELIEAQYEDGTISREEWEEIIYTYFTDLYNKED